MSPEFAEIIHRRGYSIYDDLIHGANQYPPIIQSRTKRRHKSDEAIFRENMVIVIQPNVITKDEKMGLQFGETLVVRKNGCESLNSFRRDWIICGALACKTIHPTRSQTLHQYRHDRG